MIALISEECSCDYSNHLEINSAWKLLVVSCVCVCVCVVPEAQMCFFNMFLSSAKLLISRMRHVRLQHQECLSPATKVFVPSTNHVRC